MEPTRRTVLGAAALAGLALPLREALAAPATGQAPAVEGTTLDSTVVPGPAVNAQGYRRLVSGPGEPHQVREDLGVRARAGRRARRTGLLAFAHLTDVHVVDVQSPARVEYLDRYDDGPGSALPFGAAYRPQELLTAQVADRVVQAVEQVGRGPASGRRLDFAVCTGDNTDNGQRNELRWQMAVLDGGRVHPGSGDPARFEGVADGDPLTYDPHYWHPEGAPAGHPDDQARTRYGFPVVRGLLAAATRAFPARGLSIPWYTCFGNHDGLVQGNFPRSLPLGQLAVGPVKVTSLPAGVSPDDLARGDAEAVAAVLAAPGRPVTPDPERRVLTRAETVAEHFRTGGRPLGHGYTSQNLSTGTAHYVFDPTPRVRGIVLDTVNPHGESDGSLDAAQFAWLQAELARATRQRRTVVVFSHHTSATMDNPLVSVDDPQPRVLGSDVVAALLARPAVVLWVDGHTHVHRVTAHRRATGGGFWEVSTASHVDFPSCARLVELADNGDGTLSVFGTVLDAAAPLSYGGSTADPRRLASLARELAANDWQETPGARRGSVEDRNVELVVRAPFPLR